MQFSAQEDIEAPVGKVFAMFADFERFERMAMRRGVEVRRTQQAGSSPAGMSWDTTFNIRGKPRRIQVILTDFEDPTHMRFESQSKGMQGQTGIDFLALSRQRTRVSIEMSVSARTLPARLLLQSIKLGQSRFRRQFQTRFSDFARELEERHLHGA